MIFESCATGDRQSGPAHRRIGDLFSRATFRGVNSKAYFKFDECETIDQGRIAKCFCGWWS